MAKKPKDTSPKDPLSPGHHMHDLIWGYQVFADGRVELSPSAADRMNKALDRQRGIYALLDSVNSYASQELAKIEEQKRGFWSDVINALGVSRDTHIMTYDDSNRSIAITAKPEVKP